MSRRRSSSTSLLLSICTALAVTAAAGVTTPASAAGASKKKCIEHAENGQQLQSGGKLVAARAEFDQCTASDCPAAVRKDCGRWLDDLDASTPSYTVKLEDETGQEVATGTVKVDGQLLVRSADGRALPIDPGTHHFVWTRDGGGDVTQDVVVREGEHNKLVELRAPLAPGKSVVVGSDGTKTVGPTPPPPSPSPLPWILGGAGVAIGGVGGVFWGIGLSERSDLKSTCASSHTCSDDQVSTSRTKLVVGDVMVGVGLVAIAGAVYLLVKDHGEAPPPPKTSAMR